MRWGDTVAYWARWQGDAIAVRFGERDLTWALLDRHASAIAASLQELGVERGDRVGLLMSNRPEFLEVVVACARIGAIVAPFNLRFTAVELAFVVGDADCSVVVTETALRDGLSLVEHDRSDLDIVDVDSQRWPAMAARDAAPQPVDVGDDDPFFICYTSGTTGHPKGAVLTHRSWFYASMVRSLQGGINRNDRILLPFPLAFTGGLALAMVALWTGATLVLEQAFEPGRALQLIESQRITVFMAVPTLFQLMAQHPTFAATDISSIRCASSGGAPVPVSLLQTFLDRGITMTQTYSLTEVSASGITLPYHEAFARVGSCGVPAMHSQARIVDADGNELPPGTVGEIAIKGPEVMAGYWRNPEATAATLRDGWCHTGDLGTMDADGYFYVVDRAKDMLISGGLNVYPAEIERELSGLDGIVELAVIGVADERWGETPAVIAVTDGRGLDGATVLGRCAGRLADFKLPRYLVVRPEPLPRNMSGKVLKAALRAEYADLPATATPIR
ncbi:MAG: class I adenylate-forming enzyme family protein [Ilumatobacteraceae bacterium]